MSHAAREEMIKGIEDKVKFEFEQTFMFYLPRICEHCLNPSSCMASCPSGAIYKRAEDGIVLVDQDRSAVGWRHVHLRLPLQEDLLQPQDWQGREVHLLLSPDRGRHSRQSVPRPASVACAISAWCCTTQTSRPRRRLRSRTSTDLYEAQRDVFLDPNDPRSHRQAAEREGIPIDWIDAARKSRPVTELIEASTRWPCRCTRSTAPCRWFGTSRRCLPSSM
jgi:nitrate reductase beta subunit